VDRLGQMFRSIGGIGMIRVRPSHHSLINENCPQDENQKAIPFCAGQMRTRKQWWGDDGAVGRKYNLVEQATHGGRTVFCPSNLGR
jgi:hypothetical protein